MDFAAQGLSPWFRCEKQSISNCNRFILSALRVALKAKVMLPLVYSRYRIRQSLNEQVFHEGMSKSVHLQVNFTKQAKPNQKKFIYIFPSAIALN